MEVGIECNNNTLLVLRYNQQPIVRGRFKPNLSSVNCVYPLISQQ